MDPQVRAARSPSLDRARRDPRDVMAAHVAERLTGAPRPGPFTRMQFSSVVIDQVRKDSHV